MSSIAAFFGIVGLGALATRTSLRACQRHGIAVPKFDMSRFRSMEGFDREMSRREACKILNLNMTTMNKSKIKDTHRRLLLANHPDKGGSTFLATKINEAKDQLIGSKSHHG
eukprot:GEMP01078325.1.p1 GENE.GEMP01078325.1~~GEMP01078325.1.p1  ORF type:complete len:112 (+),score=14.84 GEMP01078325.1:166-501(+)